MTRNILVATIFTLGTALLLGFIFLRENPRLEEATGAITAERIERGARDYEQYCATCHGLAGQGYVQAGAPRLNNIEARLAAENRLEGEYGIIAKYGTVRNYVASVLHSGIRNAAMPAFGAQGILRDDQIENITSYVLSWSSPITDTDAGYQGLPTGVAARSDLEATRAAPTPDPNANPVDAGGLVFQTNCASCHRMDSQTQVGPGLGGLFSEEGTAAFGTVLPNNQPVDEENVIEWIRGGSLAFPENINDLQGNDYPPMPGFPQLTDEQMANLIVWLRVHDREGNITQEGEQIRQQGAQPGGQPNVGVPTTVPTGEAQPPTAPDTQAQPTSEVNQTAEAEEGTTESGESTSP